MGMIKERIRTEEQNQRHRTLVAENRRLKLRKYQEQAENRLVCISRFLRRPALNKSIYSLAFFV